MERIPNAYYTKELREEAVKLVTEQGLTIPDVGRRLSIPKSTISYWVKEKRLMMQFRGIGNIVYGVPYCL